MKVIRPRRIKYHLEYDWNLGERVHTVVPLTVKRQGSFPGSDDGAAGLPELVTVPADGACPIDLIEFDPFETFNGEDLFYVPRLNVKNTGQWVEPGDPRVVGVPDTWQWPGERIGIWRVYPDVTQPPPKEVEADPLKRVPTFSPFWWLNYTGP